MPPLADVSASLPCFVSNQVVERCVVSSLGVYAGIQDFSDYSVWVGFFFWPRSGLGSSARFGTLLDGFGLAPEAVRGVAGVEVEQGAICRGRAFVAVCVGLATQGCALQDSGVVLKR